MSNKVQSDSSSVGPSCSVVDSTPTHTSEQTKTSTNNSTTSRKKAFIKFVKDPQTITEDLMRKRAKNTEAARRSRQRRVERMESLEKQVAELTIENTELKTRLTVLEIEKKSLEEKNLDKDIMIISLPIVID
ncbi:basic-leucine zipper transcription factor [Rhizophagus clarus]|uniref:Basic-leucine zipper transcription factor n=1 Tax=Rhizophagus clarus TaxID=94130 RepID=A0A8H3LIP1_9GLOM|nr:basic-leucine zipper transcription factor [Rhizophagus clarus]